MFKSHLDAWRQCPLYIATPLLMAFLAADHLYMIDPWPGLLLATLFWAAFLLLLPLERATVMILSAGMPLYWWWLSHTAYEYQAHDIPWHVEYIQYIAQHWSLPRPDAGWSFYHPPLYYTVAALWYKLAVLYGARQPMEGVRMLSLYSFLAFLIGGALTLRLAALPKHIYWLCLALVVFWPPSIMIASRTESDLPMYALCMASFYYLVRWHKALEPRDLRRSLLWLGLAIMTRSNTIVLMAVLGALMAYNLWRRRFTLSALRNRRFALCALFLALAVSLNVGRVAYLHISGQSDMPLIVGNGPMVSSIGIFHLTDEPEDFLTFDAKHYLWPPFANAASDDSGRRNFWTMLFKTSLWGEFRVPFANGARMANVLLVLLAACTLLPVLRYSRSEWGERLPHILLPFVSVCALLVNRYRVTMMPSGDVRYVYFFIVPMAILFGYALVWMRRSGYEWLFHMSVAAALALLIVSDALYMMQV